MDNGCPCYVLNEPCIPQCTCVNSLMSGGCRRCAKYGSLEQRQVKAKKLINTAADKDRQIAVLTRRQTGFIAALVTIQTTLQNSRVQDNKHRIGTLTEQDIDYAVRVASEVLAEVKRIQEGE